MIIAIDFDGTLCEFAYPLIGQPDYDIINKTKEAIRKGHILILWTCRDGEELKEAIEWCSWHDLYFDYVNKNCKEVKNRYGDPRKICCDLYVDDKSPGSINHFLKLNF